MISRIRLRKKHVTTHRFVGELQSCPCKMCRFPQSARNERGGTLVESALMISTLLVMLFGIIGFGHALYTYHFVSNAAREATRWASVRGHTCSGLSGGCPIDLAGADVQTYVSSVSGMGLDSTKITATTTWIAPPNSLAVCSVSGKQNSPGCVVQVRVRYTYQFLVPLLPAGFTMQSTSQMVISQ
jgi:Flp pilus assembly protein TadG